MNDAKRAYELYNGYKDEDVPGEPPKYPVTWAHVDTLKFSDFLVSQFKDETPSTSPVSHVDQYGQVIPADLVLIPDGKGIKASEAKVVEALDWWVCQEMILVPDNGMGGEDPRDAGIPLDKDGNIDLPEGSVMKVDDVLKRWNKVDGFYHA